MKEPVLKNPFRFIAFLTLIVASSGTAFRSSYAGEDLPRAAVGAIEVALDEGTNMAAALSPDGQTIALDLLGRLWLLPAQGGLALAVTDPLGDARQPAWSPDGQYLTFQGYGDGNWHIYTVRRDGTELRQRTTGPFDHREPHWSTDGRNIAFSADRGGTYDIWSLALETDVLTPLTKEPANEYAPAWSPDGSQLCFVSDDLDGRGIKVYSMAKGRSQLVYETDEARAGPAWNPDGRSLFFNQLGFAQSRLLQISVSGRKDVTVGLSAPEEDVFPFRTSFASTSEIIYSASG